MADVALIVHVPSEAFAMLRLSPEETAREMRLAAAMHWYSRGTISEEKAAQFAGLTRSDFLRALASAEIAVHDVDVDELQREIDIE